MSFLKNRRGAAVKDEDVGKMEALKRVWLSSKGLEIDMQQSPEADASGLGRPGQSRARIHSN